MNVIRRSIARWRMRRALQNGRQISFEEAARLWRLSDTIYIGPVGPAARLLPEYELYQKFADDLGVTNTEIMRLLEHKSPSVAGYGLELLIRRRAEGLEDAALKLAGRLELVTMGITSFVSYSPLCEYAQNRLQAQQDAAGNPLPDM